MPSGKPPNAVRAARRSREDGLMFEMALQVRSQCNGAFIATLAILFERLHRDPAEIAAQLPREATRVGVTFCGYFFQSLRRQGVKRRHRAHWLLIAEKA